MSESTEKPIELSNCDDRLQFLADCTDQHFYQMIRWRNEPSNNVNERPHSFIYPRQSDLKQRLLCTILSGANTRNFKSPDQLNEFTKQAENQANLLWDSYSKVPIHCTELRPPVARPVEISLLVRYKQTWCLIGYSRGELLNSLSLAPGEEMTIEIFDWDRRILNQERESDSSVESVESGTVTSSTSSEVVSNVQFKVGVGSSTKIGGELSLEALEIPGNVSADASVNFDSELSTSVQQTRNRVSEATRTATSTMRSARKTRITQTHEFGREERVTRRIVNTNRCHTVNFDYFEILEHIDVSTAVDTVEFIVRVPLPDTGNVDTSWLLCNEHSLRRHLLAASYQSGFDAAALLQAVAKFREIISTPLIPSPTLPTPDKNDDGDVPNIDPIRAHFKPIVDSIVNAANCLQSEDAIMDLDDWVQLGNIFDSNAQSAAFEKAAKHIAREQVVAVFPGIFDLINTLEAQCSDSASPVSNCVQPLQFLLTQITPNILGGLKFGLAPMVYLGILIPPNYCGLLGAIDHARTEVEDYRPAVVTELLAEDVLPDAPTPIAGVQPMVSIQDRIDQTFGHRQVAEAQVRVDQLICHIRDNLDHYLSGIYMDKGAAGWQQILAGYPHVQAVINLRMLGIVDGHALFPLNNREQKRLGLDVVKKHLSTIETEDAFKVVMPTAGTVLESRLGQCSACELFIEGHRKLDLQDKEAELKLKQNEVRRTEMRLDAAPPDLSAPEHPPGNALIVELQQLADEG